VTCEDVVSCCETGSESLVSGFETDYVEELFASDWNGVETNSLKGVYNSTLRRFGSVLITIVSCGEPLVDWLVTLRILGFFHLFSGLLIAERDIIGVNVYFWFWFLFDDLLF
jgi:hypothetical protein